MPLSRDDVSRLFGNLEQGNGDAFFAQVADDVHWTIEGVQPVSGTYHCKTALLKEAIGPVNAIFSHPPQFQVQHIYVDGDTAIVEMHAVHTTNKRGVPFETTYGWVCRFADDKIV